MKQIFQDLTVGKGIANALKFFGDRGMLGKEDILTDYEKNRTKFIQVQSTTDVIIGRNNDMTLAKQLKQLG